MSDGNSNIRSERQSSSSSFKSPSRLSASASPFNFKSNSKTHDHDESSFQYNLECVYGHNYVPPFGFENEPKSYLFHYPSKSESYLLDNDAASMAYNSIFNIDENTPYSSENNFSQARERASSANTTHLLHKDTMACHERILIDKGKEKQNCEIVIKEAIDTLVIAKKDPSPGVLDDFNRESCKDETFVPVQTSSVMSDLNDSDVDSPCWKGTGFCQSAFRDPVSMSSELPKAGGESRKSLNPLAPHFFPGNAKQLVDCHGNNCEESDSSSFKKAPSSVASSSKEHRLTNFVKAGTCSSEVCNTIENQFSNDPHDAGKVYSLPKKLNTCSVLHSSPGDGSCPSKGDLTFNGQGVTGAFVSGSVKGMKPAILNGSTSVSFAPTGNLLTSILSRDGASSHFCETHRGALKSAPPKIDLQLVIKTMHDLSELLRWNCSNDTIKEHEHDMIHRIMDNLHVCITNKVRQRVSLSESGHPCNSYCPVKLTDRFKEFQVMKMKLSTVAHDQERQKGSPPNFSKKVLASSSSRSNKGINIDDVPPLQIIGKALKERQIVEEMHPRHLLNGNFWPNANTAPRL